MAFKSTWTPPPKARDMPPPEVSPRLSGGFTYSASGGVGAIEKENAVVCQEYRSIVRTMDCMHCGISGYTQFCHGDQNKGMGLKTDDRTGWPGCGPHGHKPGCHYVIGSTGTFTKQERRDLEAEYARRTRAEVKRRGLWPKNLPEWSEE